MDCNSISDSINDFPMEIDTNIEVQQKMQKHDVIIMLGEGPGTQFEIVSERQKHILIIHYMDMKLLSSRW